LRALALEKPGPPGFAPNWAPPDLDSAARIEFGSFSSRVQTPPPSSKSTAGLESSGLLQPITPANQGLRQPINQPGPGEYTQTPGATPRKDFRIPESEPGVNGNPKWRTGA
jgi:hypothetical protein